MSEQQNTPLAVIGNPDRVFWQRLDDLASRYDELDDDEEAEHDRLVEERSQHPVQGDSEAEREWMLEREREKPQDPHAKRAWARVGIDRGTRYTDDERGWYVGILPTKLDTNRTDFGRLVVQCGSQFYVFVGGQYLGPYVRAAANKVARDAVSLCISAVTMWEDALTDRLARRVVKYSYVIDRFERVPGKGVPDIKFVGGQTVLEQPIADMPVKRTPAEWALDALLDQLESGDAFCTTFQGEQVIGYRREKILHGAPAGVGAVLTSMTVGRVRRGADRSRAVRAADVVARAQAQGRQVPSFGSAGIPIEDVFGPAGPAWPDGRATETTSKHHLQRRE